MGKRRAFGDPGAIFDALSPVMQAAIAEEERDLGLPERTWFRVPAARNWFTLIAVNRVAAVLQREKGCSWTAAFREAAEQLGFEDNGESQCHPADGLARLQRDWWHQAWKKSSRPSRTASRIMHTSEDGP